MNIVNAMGIAEVEEQYSTEEREILMGLNPRSFIDACETDAPGFAYRCTCRKEHRHGHVAHNSYGDVVATWPKEEKKQRKVTVVLSVKVVAADGSAEPGKEDLTYTCTEEELDAIVAEGKLWGNGPVDYVTKKAIKHFKRSNSGKGA